MSRQSSELSAPARAAAYVAGLVVVLVVTFGIGRLVGHGDVETPPSHSDRHSER